MSWRMRMWHLLTARMRSFFQSAIRNPQSAIFSFALLPLFLAAAPSSCSTTGGGSAGAADLAARAEMRQKIANEPAGDYWVGRRYYNANYKFWGYIRRPQQPWKGALLVVLNEQGKFAPDRALGQLGLDNNSEYRIKGRFTGETIYESASNSFYPEFVATNFDLINPNPPTIFEMGYRASPTEIIKPDA